MEKQMPLSSDLATGELEAMLTNLSARYLFPAAIEGIRAALAGLIPQTWEVHEDLQGGVQVRVDALSMTIPGLRVRVDYEGHARPMLAETR